jgi:hypothetical protein
VRRTDACRIACPLLIRLSVCSFVCRYVSGFTGATDKYVMIPLWEWCLQFVPIWMASVETRACSAPSQR